MTLDYTSFAHAYGGDYGRRLELVRLPACAVTTPERAACRSGTALASRNDTENETVSADVTVATARAGPGRDTSTVLAAVSAPSGDKGDYKATELKASATWKVGTQSGDFGWSYPMRVPPVPGDLTPNVTIGYSSGSIDGRTANTNNQPSWVGEGFDLWPGYIQRNYKSCEDDGAPEDEFGNESGDQCWAYDNATVSWNGRAGELIKASDGTWRQKNDDGTRFQRLADTGKANGDEDGEYWKVTTVDGTQYFFGLNRLPGWSSGDDETGSAWTAPVFGNDTGEPCKESTYAASWCQQAWRWNLDYVVDPHGNAISYWYTQEGNRYGRNIKPADDTPYDRGGYLDRIEYGQRSNSIFSVEAPARVVFTPEERCLPNSSFDCAPSKIADNPDKWPDVPWDLNCASGTECKDDHGTIAPTFWSRKLLGKVTTQVVKADLSGYRNVDSWTLKHAFGDADVDRALLLSSITRKGEASGTPITLPPVTFSYVQRMNRLDRIGDDIAPFIKYRLGAVMDESGGQIDVNYTDGQCDLDALLTPETNTKRCFPVIWTPQGFTDPKRDWFHKYVVSQVIQSDRTTRSPDMITDYHYVGGAAWHYDDDDGLTKQKYKTWSQWRGYQDVRVETGGNDGMVSRSDHRFLRGMDGDRLNKDGGRKDVSVSDGEGGTYIDHEAMVGFGLKTTRYDGPTGPVVDKTVGKPWRHQTASRTRSWGTTTANLVRSAATRTWTALSGGQWRETRNESAYDETTGLVTSVDDEGDVSTASDDRCTRTTYAQSTTRWMHDFPARVETVAADCDSTPDRATDVISDVRTFYDGGDFDVAPTKGDETRSEVITDHDGATATYLADAVTTYDQYGRATSVTDAEEQTTTTGYTDSAGLLTRTKETGPAVVPGDASTAFVTTTDFDPAWGLPLTEIDPNLYRTDLRYDALGRLREVWLPNNPIGNPKPNHEFTYHLSDGEGAAVGSRELTATLGQTAPTYTLYDGWLRSRQVQEPGANGGRVISDTFHDTRGNLAAEYDTYYSTGAPVTTLFGVDVPGTIETQTAHTYDGVGRKTVERFLVGNGETQERWRTSYSYSGDRVNVNPPAGGTPTTTITDARDQTVELRQYEGDEAAGAYDSTTYTYTPAGQPRTVTDPAGNVWTHEYDLRGRETWTEDPATGVTTREFDDLDRLTSTTDARDRTLATTYDPLGRKTALRDDSAEDPMLLASWTYDTVRKGQLSWSTRHVDGHQYTTRVLAYDKLYTPSRYSVTIPANEGELAGTYSFTDTLAADGTVRSQGFSAAGGLPSDTVVYSRDELKRVVRSSGNVDTYVTDALYSNTGQLEQLELSTGGKRVWQTNSYEYGTRRLSASRTDREDVNGVDRDARYGYDDAGNVTKISDVSLSGVDTQCFQYDHLRRMTQAWSQGIAECAAEASSAVVGGVAPYWSSYAYDVAGNRTGEVIHGVGAAGDMTRTYHYPAEGSPRPNALESVSQSGAAGERTDEFAHDAAGNMTRRAVDGVEQVLEWDAEGHLAEVSEGGQEVASFLYDADGERLIRRDPAGTTLYLPNTEVRLNAAGTTVSGTRFYTHGPDGQVVAVRTESGVSFLSADAHGTAELAIDADSQEVTQRRFDPFGVPRGGPASGWPSERGFVGGTVDGSTGLTHLGAREYDPTLGRFISVDPVLDPGDPQQMNGYAYANNSPATFTDPDGLLASCGDWGCGSGHSSSHGGSNHGGGGGGSHVNGPSHHWSSWATAVRAAVSRHAKRAASVFTGWINRNLLSQSVLNPLQDAPRTTGGVGGPVPAPVLGPGDMKRLLKALTRRAGHSTATIPTSQGTKVPEKRIRTRQAKSQACGDRECVPWISSSLPAAEEAALSRTLKFMDAGTKPTGPAGTNWGRRYKNYQELLPGGTGKNSPYKEYRVIPRRSSGPGPLRVVYDTRTGRTYYTWTHYGDQGRPTFVRIR